MTTAGENALTLNDPSSKPPKNPPPAIARFHAVTSIDYATSAASPAVLAMAVWNNVAAPPKESPQTATAV